VYLKILENTDDPRAVSNYTLKDICYLIEEFSYDDEVAHVVKDVYKELVKRSGKYNNEEIEAMDQILSRLTNLKTLKFIPRLKLDVTERRKRIDLNKLVFEELGFDRQDKKIDVNFNHV
jgi:hypothetical protein